MARFEEFILLRLVRSDGCQHVLEEMSLYSHFVAIVALPSNYHLKALFVDLFSSTITIAGGTVHRAIERVGQRRRGSMRESIVDPRHVAFRSKCARRH